MSDVIGGLPSDTAELVDASGRRVGESRRFARSVPIQAENAAAAVEAANRAIAEALDEIAAWTAAAGRERPTASAASSVFRP
jgi:ABC-type uncharacterized transport system auxiliary subunit